MLNFISKQLRITGAGLMWIALAGVILVLGSLVASLVAGMAWAVYTLAKLLAFDVVGLGTFLGYGAVIIVVANMVGPFALSRLTGQQVAAVQATTTQRREATAKRAETAAEVRARRQAQQQAYEDWAMAGGGYAKSTAKADALGKARTRQAAKHAAARRLDAQVDDAGL
jgi:hypothetical protein